MKKDFNLDKIIENKLIDNELDYQKALIHDRKLRLLAKDNSHFKELRKKLREIIVSYENANWNLQNQASDSQVIESDNFERIAEYERQFIENRKQVIKKKLKELDLNQENLTLLLGHKSKTHMSELINGIKPFTLKDLVIINRLLHIDLSILIPPFLSAIEQEKIKNAIQILGKPKVKLSTSTLANYKF